ncbi:aquaporin TIP4-4-like [Phalaenopsis equestris]|uniref:aquaporin TIP4-4-like n=1 Tax=Phalaenopsis equestris TaxID=78828 RepID=UPI0009E54855|nr:aquaporin TIP4-4-like [Phalaenopsis equestris]
MLTKLAQKLSDIDLYFLRSTAGELFLTFLFVFTTVGAALASETIQRPNSKSSRHGIRTPDPRDLHKSVRERERDLTHWCDLLCKSLESGEIPVHALGSGVGSFQGLGMEMILTFSLLFTIYATMVEPGEHMGPGSGPLIVGLIVGANTLSGGVFTGASMNPARSFGPALVTWNWINHWIYWAGPIFGGVLAGFIYERFGSYLQGRHMLRFLMESKEFEGVCFNGLAVFFILFFLEFKGITICAHICIYF